MIGGEARRYRRWIELELRGELPARLRTQLHDHLRVNPEARAEYDRGIAALRALEGDVDVSRVELEQVEEWLFEGTAPAASERRGAWRWLVGATAVAAAALALWINAPVDEPEFTARGAGKTGGLAIGALCAEQEQSDRFEAIGGAPSVAMRPAALEPCPLSGVLGFEYRAVSHEGASVLTLFGVDARGRVMYYAPTPIDPDGVAVAYGRSIAAPVTVRLSVNHEPGELRVYGLLSPMTPTITQIDAWASALAAAPSASRDDAEPWHLRVDPKTMGACPDLILCESAEVRVLLREEPR